MPKEYFEPYCKHTVFDIQRSKDVMKNKHWFYEKCRYLYDRYKEKMYEYNKCRSDCKRHLLTECKTNYKKYMYSVKSEFMRCQGNEMEYLRRNSRYNVQKYCICLH